MDVILVYFDYQLCLSSSFAHWALNCVIYIVEGPMYLRKVQTKFITLKIIIIIVLKQNAIYKFNSSKRFWPSIWIFRTQLMPKYLKQRPSSSNSLPTSIRFSVAASLNRKWHAISSISLNPLIYLQFQFQKEGAVQIRQILCRPCRWPPWIWSPW